MIALISAILLVACNTQPDDTTTSVNVTIIADGRQSQITVLSGSSVQNALEKANIQLNPLDKVEPPTFTTIENSIQIKVTRVTEEFILEEKVIPFERQTVRNEALPAGQTMLIQPGVNGIQQITYRIVRENGIE
ncbi:MAG: G5 domain-containing protein, partial [Anaerolineales bacterium]